MFGSFLFGFFLFGFRPIYTFIPSPSAKECLKTKTKQGTTRAMLFPWTNPPMVLEMVPRTCPPQHTYPKMSHYSLLSHIYTDHTRPISTLVYLKLLTTCHHPPSLWTSTNGFLPRGGRSTWSSLHDCTVFCHAMHLCLDFSKLLGFLQENEKGPRAVIVPKLNTNWRQIFHFFV